MPTALRDVDRDDELRNLYPDPFHSAVGCARVVSRIGVARGRWRSGRGSSQDVMKDVGEPLLMLMWPCLLYQQCLLSHLPDALLPSPLSPSCRSSIDTLIETLRTPSSVGGRRRCWAEVAMEVTTALQTMSCRKSVRAEDGAVVVTLGGSK